MFTDIALCDGMYVLTVQGDAPYVYDQQANQLYPTGFPGGAIGTIETLIVTDFDGSLFGLDRTNKAIYYYDTMMNGWFEEVKLTDLNSNITTVHNFAQDSKGCIVITTDRDLIYRPARDAVWKAWSVEMGSEPFGGFDSLVNVACLDDTFYFVTANKTECSNSCDGDEWASTDFESTVTGIDFDVNTVNNTDCMIGGNGVLIYVSGSQVWERKVSELSNFGESKLNCQTPIDAVVNNRSFYEGGKFYILANNNGRICTISLSTETRKVVGDFNELFSLIQRLQSRVEDLENRI